MAKRFIDTGLFDDEFFMDLTKDGKIFFIYLITKCSHAGIINLNKKLASYQTDIDDIAIIMQSFDNHLVMIKEGLYFIPKFIEFQYPTGLESKKPAIVSVVKELRKYKLLDNDYLIVKDKDKDKDKDRDKDRDKDKENKDYGDVKIYRQFDHLAMAQAGYNKIIALGYSKEQVDDMLDQIENYAENTKYKNLTTTVKNWLIKEYGIPSEKEDPKNLPRMGL